ncbi:ankyrin repeat-containing domain protein [Aspergillus oleicola]
MEFVSGTASIVQLLAAAITVTETTVALLRAIRDAPRELQDIAVKVSIVKSQLYQLNIIKDSVGYSDDKTLLPEFRKNIELSLDKTRLANMELQAAIRSLQAKSCSKAKSGIPLPTRVRWALLDRGKVAVLCQRLHEAEHSLSLSLRILEMQINIKAKTIVVAIHNDIDQVVSRLHNVENSLEQMQLTPFHEDHGHSLDKRSTHYYLHPSPRGGRAECHYYTSTESSFTTCTLDIPLPVPYCASRVLRLRVRTQHLPSSALGWGWGFQLEQMSLSIKRLVPDDAEVMRLCKEGKLVAVQKMFQAGRASAGDVTYLGLTVLMCAIESGNLDLVKFLVTAGADVNAQLDQSNTNTLQLAAKHNHLDIFLYLIHQNANTDHVDSSGWTVAFYLWPYFSISPHGRTSFLKILHNDGGCNLSTHQGVGSWTALHRAATSGTSEDISTLVKYGASTSTRTKDLNWAPIHYATLSGNTKVLEGLTTKAKYQTDIDTRDARGWSPLHIAAYAGAYPTLCALLRLGADLEARSWRRVGADVPCRVTTRDVTAAELAGLKGEKEQDIFLQAVQTVRGSTSQPEVFWDAVETV